MISAASGMKARMESLDMLANNVANSATSGFKADGEFYSLYEAQLPVVETHWTDFSQGSLTATGNPLNLALAGPGFFALTAPSGVIYTRSGHFRVSKTNQLVSQDGYPLRDIMDPANPGRPIVVDPTQPITIEKSGEVVQGGQAIAQIQIDQLPAVADATAKLGNMYFALRAQPTPDLPTQAAPAACAAGCELRSAAGVYRRVERARRGFRGSLDHRDAPIRDAAKGHEHWSADGSSGARGCREAELEGRTMIRALYSAGSGMNAQQMSIDNIANNLANANTTGFKARRTEFADLLYQNFLQPGASAGSQTVVPSGLQLGLGTRPTANSVDLSQGSFQLTNNPLDVVIQGKGFFQIRRTDGTIAYTRAGDFQLNKDGAGGYGEWRPSGARDHHSGAIAIHHHRTGWHRELHASRPI